MRVISENSKGLSCVDEPRTLKMLAKTDPKMVATQDRNGRFPYQLSLERLISGPAPPSRSRALRVPHSKLGTAWGVCTGESGALYLQPKNGGFRPGRP